MSAGAPAIRVEGLTKRFGRRWALKGIDLHVAPGSVIALLGANGTGKTTLLRVLATLLRPTAGVAEVLGASVETSPDEIRRHAALMTPLGHAYDELTGVENLVFAARMCGRPRSPDTLRQALSDVGIGAAADLPVRSYSTGMRKRLELARMRLIDPRVVLLDEPFTSLDEDGVELVQDEIARWRENGATIVIASHQVAAAGRHADRAVRLMEGRVVEEPTA